MALGILQLTLIAYFLVAAGPYGVEAIVKATGPLYACLGTILLPLLLSIPLSLIFSEMCSLYPQPGSTIMWAQNIVLQLPENSKAMKTVTRVYANSLFFKACVANALIPVLISDYVASFWDQASHIVFKLVIAFFAF